MSARAIGGISSKKRYLKGNIYESLTVEVTRGYMSYEVKLECQRDETDPIYKTPWYLTKIPDIEDEGESSVVTMEAIDEAHRVSDKELLDSTKDKDLPLLINYKWLSEYGRESYKSRLSSISLHI